MFFFFFFFFMKSRLKARATCELKYSKKSARSQKKKKKKKNTLLFITLMNIHFYRVHILFMRTEKSLYAGFTSWSKFSLLFRVLRYLYCEVSRGKILTIYFNPLSASGLLLGHYMVPLSASGPLLGHCLFVIRKMHSQQIYALTYTKNCKIRNITVIKGHKKRKTLSCYDVISPHTRRHSCTYSNVIR